MKRNLIRLFAFALAASLACSAYAADTVKEYNWWLQADMVIAADGSVESLQWKKGQPGAQLIIDKIEPRVRQWQFEPGAIEGVPAVTHTQLSVQVLGRAHGDDGLALRITDASTGMAADVSTPPRFPVSAARRGFSASVLSVISVDADGRPTHVETAEYTSSTTNDRARDEFLAATEAAIRSWTFTPERVGGHRIAGRVRIPVDYCGPDSDWCEQLNEARNATTGTSTRPVALDSAARLVTDIGTLEI